MVTIKHKVTIKTKTAQEETPAAVESPVVTLKRKQPETPAPKVAESPKVEIKKKQPETPVTPVTPTPSEPGKKSNTGKIVGGVVAAAAILAGIYFFEIKNNDTKTGEDEAQSEQVAQADNSVNKPKEKDTSATDKTANASESGKDATENETTEANPSDTDGSSSDNEIPAANAGNNASAAAKPEARPVDKPTSQPVQQSQAKQNATSKPDTPTASEPLSGDVSENARRVIRGDFGNGKERKDKLGAAYSEIQSKVNEMYRQGLAH